MSSEIIWAPTLILTTRKRDGCSRASFKVTQQQPTPGAHLEGYDDEPMPGPGTDEGALTEIDGSYLATIQAFLSCLVAIFLRQSFVKTSSTIRLQETFAGQT